MATDKLDRRQAACSFRSEKHNPLKAFRRIKAHVRDSFIHRQQNSPSFFRRCENSRIGKSRQLFVKDGICFVTEAANLISDLDGQILVNLKFHIPATGSKASSWASSAA